MQQWQEAQLGLLAQAATDVRGYRRAEPFDSQGRLTNKRVQCQCVVLCCSSNRTCIACLPAFAAFFLEKAAFVRREIGLAVAEAHLEANPGC